MTVPPPRPLPELPPLPGQAEAALRQVRERRRRSLRVAASSAGVVVAAALLVTLRSPSTAVLDQTDEGVTQTATAVPSPTGHGREADRATGPRLATPTPGTVPGAPRRPVPSPSDAPSAGVTLSPSPTASVRPRPPVTRERFSSLNADYVNDRQGRCAGGGSCQLPGSTARENDVLLRITVCASGSEPTELRFPTEQEIDVIVRTDAERREVWRWSLGQAFAQEPHTIALAPSECVRWSVPWDYRDEAGARVPKGRYYVALPLLSDPGSDLATYVQVP